MENTYKTRFTDYLKDCNDGALLLPEEFSDALVGVAHQFTKTLAVYDTKKIISIMVENWKISEDEAMEFYLYNMQGSYAGENTPLFLESIDDILM
tara:strand:- start:1125 stop:1409 length:285 start_codon:yes stop_codon:yes gene_type:complete